MDDGRHTTVFLRFTRMMDTYLPSLDGFDEIFTEEKIHDVSIALKSACLPQAKDEEFAEVEDVSIAWVCTLHDHLSAGPDSTVPERNGREVHTLPRIYT